MRANEFITEAWSEKYKRSINCSNPKGFSQRAHCQGKKKTSEEVAESYNNDVLLEQQLYENFMNSAKQFLGSKVNQKITDVKGAVIDFANAGIVIKDIISNEKLLNNSIGILSKYIKQQIKDVNTNITQMGAQLNSSALSKKLSTVWNFITTKVYEFITKSGFKGFLGLLGMYGFVKFFSEITKKLTVLKSTLASGAIDKVSDIVQNFISSMVGEAENITMTAFFNIFNTLTTIKKYFFDILNDIKNKINSINIGPQFSQGLSEDELEEACWDSYKQVGMKNKSGKMVPNCVPKESIDETNEEQLEEDLRKWFKEKWVRFGPDGKIRGSCARGSEGEGKPKCLPQKKAHALGKKKRASAASRKRRQDPNPERQGKAKNVPTKSTRDKK